MIIIDIFPPMMFKSALKNNQWTDVDGPYSQINSFQNVSRAKVVLLKDM